VRSKADKEANLPHEAKTRKWKKNYTTDNNISSLFVTEYRGRVPWWGYDVGVAIHVVRVMDGRSLAVQLVL